MRFGVKVASWFEFLFASNKTTLPKINDFNVENLQSELFGQAFLPTYSNFVTVGLLDLYGDQGGFHPPYYP